MWVLGEVPLQNLSTVVRCSGPGSCSLVGLREMTALPFATVTNVAAANALVCDFVGVCLARQAESGLGMHAGLPLLTARSILDALCRMESGG